MFGADLGGYLFKKRIARSGKGKSGGYRTILRFRKSGSDRIFFLYGFAKNERSNVTARERQALAIVARSLIEASDEQLVMLANRGAVLELECGV